MKNPYPANLSQLDWCMFHAPNNQECTCPAHLVVLGCMDVMLERELEEIEKIKLEEQLSYFERVHKETPMVDLSVRHVTEWGVTDEDLCKAYGCISRKLRYLRALVAKREIEGINTRLEKRDIAAFEIGLLLIARYQFKRGILPAKVKGKKSERTSDV